MNNQRSPAIPADLVEDIRRLLPYYNGQPDWSLSVRPGTIEVKLVFTRAREQRQNQGSTGTWEGGENLHPTGNGDNPPTNQVVRKKNVGAQVNLGKKKSRSTRRKNKDRAAQFSAQHAAQQQRTDQKDQPAAIPVISPARSLISPLPVTPPFQGGAAPPSKVEADNIIQPTPLEILWSQENKGRVNLQLEYLTASSREQGGNLGEVSHPHIKQEADNYLGGNMEEVPHRQTKQEVDSDIHLGSNMEVPHRQIKQEADSDIHLGSNMEEVPHRQIKQEADSDIHLESNMEVPHRQIKQEADSDIHLGSNMEVPHRQIKQEADSDIHPGARGNMEEVPHRQIKQEADIHLSDNTKDGPA